MLVCLQVISFSQEKPKTNLEVFEETISVELEKYYYYPGVNRNLPFVFVLNPDEKSSSSTAGNETKFMNGLVKKTASANKLNFSITDDVSKITSDSVYNIIILQVIKLETRYNGFKKNRFLGEKTLSRNIIINIAVELKTADSTVKLKDFIKHNLNDEVAYDNYEQLESPVYGFTKGVPPKVSTFERVIFPVLLICATAAATIIFFTIRSK
jgi:hypothetical protein